MASEVLSGRVVLGIRSFLALLLGLVGFFMVVLAVFMPGTTAVLVVRLFASYALLDGLLSIFAAARAVRRALPRFLTVLEGLVDVATSVTAFILVQGDRPRGLLVLIAAWAIVTGVLQLGWTFSIDIHRGRLVLLLPRLPCPWPSACPCLAGGRPISLPRCGASPCMPFFSASCV